MLSKIEIIIDFKGLKTNFSVQIIHWSNQKESKPLILELTYSWCKSTIVSISIEFFYKRDEFGKIGFPK